MYYNFIQMAKDEQRRKAEDMYIKEGKSAKYISDVFKVTPKTVGNWVAKYNWKARRAAHASSIKSAEENFTKLANVYAEKLLLLSQEDPGDDLEEKERISKEEVRLGDLIAKLNKSREGFEKNNRIPYNVYINVAEQIMAAQIKTMPEDTHGNILDFFEDHINNIALNYR